MIQYHCLNCDSFFVFIRKDERTKSDRCPNCGSEKIIDRERVVMTDVLYVIYAINKFEGNNSDMLKTNDKYITLHGIVTKEWLMANKHELAKFRKETKARVFIVPKNVFIKEGCVFI